MTPCIYLPVCWFLHVLTYLVSKFQSLVDSPHCSFAYKVWNFFSPPSSLHKHFLESTFCNQFIFLFDVFIYFMVLKFGIYVLLYVSFCVCCLGMTLHHILWLAVFLFPILSILSLPCVPLCLVVTPTFPPRNPFVITRGVACIFPILCLVPFSPRHSPCSLLSAHRLLFVVSPVC